MKIGTRQRIVAGLLMINGAAFAVETPFTPFKDGYANPSLYNGTSKTLIVRAGDSKGWVAHALGDGAATGLQKARLQVYVKDVIKDGTLRVYLAANLNFLENQTRFENLKSADSLGSVHIGAAKDIQTMVSIPLAPAVLAKIADGSFGGLILVGADGLDAEIGALEGAHGALLFLDYAAGSTGKIDSMLADTVAGVLAAKYGSVLIGPAGAKGAKGDAGAAGAVGPVGASGSAGVKGDKGDSGVAGAKGDKGDKGDAGASADQAPIFNLILDRGARALYSFDRFGTAGANRTSPDSSGNGNTLVLSTDGTSRIENAPGDSAVQFLGNGYATTPNSASLSPYQAIALSASVKLSTEAPPDSQTLVAKSGQYEMAVIGSKLRCRFKTVSSDWAWVGDGTITGGVTTKVAASYDGSAVRTYINGVQVSYTPYSKGPIALDTAPLFVGARDAATGTFGAYACHFADYQFATDFGRQGEYGFYGWP